MGHLVNHACAYQRNSASFPRMIPMHRRCAASILFATVLATSVSLLRGADSNSAAHLRLTSPLDYQVHQRADRAGGKIIIAGTLVNDTSSAAIIEARLIDAHLTNLWQKITSAKPGTNEFRAELSAPSGGWYRLEVRAKNELALLAEATVEHVGVGEIFVVAGQSNSANHGEEKQKTTTRLVAAFSGDKWQPANDPQPGASGNGGSFIPPFGDRMALRFNVPIGIVAAGVGATSVREW